MASQSRSQAKASGGSTSKQQFQGPQLARESSPVWHIELEDADLPAEDEDSGGPSRRPNDDQVFDIDLDLT